MLDGYTQGRIIKAVDRTGQIVGVLSYDVQSEYVYFGPFAVCPKVKGTGLGRLLMNELHDVAISTGVNCIEMNVVNWRTDLIPMYERMGFTKIREEPFPEPHKVTRPSLLYVYRKVLGNNSNAQNATNSIDSAVPAQSVESELPVCSEPVVAVVDKAPTTRPVMPPAPPSMSSTQIKSPWASINNMLIQNRCWLCETVFPRGKQKKVFQVSDLLDFYTTRLRAEDGTPSSGHTVINSALGDRGEEESESVSSGVMVSDDSTVSPVVLVEIISKNLRSCYESFVAIVHEDPTGTRGLLRAEFVENDVEVWMSGLVCGISADCKRDLALFIKPKASSSSTTGTAGGKPTNMFGGLLGSGKDKDGNDCPPGCGCDNPWPFLA
jgi:hypothetical protein